MPLLSDQIQEFIDWLKAYTDFGDWDLETQGVVHKKLIECLISVPVASSSSRERDTRMTQEAIDKAEANLGNARLALNDWVNCSTNEQLERWRNAQRRLINAAKAVGALASPRASAPTANSLSMTEWKRPKLAR